MQTRDIMRQKNPLGHHTSVHIAVQFFYKFQAVFNNFRIQKTDHGSVFYKMVQFKSSAENPKQDCYTSTTLTNLAMIHHENAQYVASFRSRSTASSLQTHSLYFLIQLLISINTFIALTVMSDYLSTATYQGFHRKPD